MKIRLIVSMLIILCGETYALKCLKQCRLKTDDCSKLSYYMSYCVSCGRQMSSQCTKSFCQNNPTLCDEKGPLKDLSINTQNIRDDGKILDVCMARLFLPLKINDQDNGDLSLSNLNMLSIVFFDQTGGDALKRNLGTLRKLVGNNLVDLHPELRQNEKMLNTRIDQWIIKTSKKEPDHLTSLDFHILVEEVRKEIFKRRGIDAHLKVETYKGQKFPMTVSKLGCTGEK